MRLYLVLICLVLFLSGCLFRMPTTKNEKAEKKVEEAQKKIDQNLNAQTDKSKGYFWGSGYSLAQETNPTPAVKVAKELNDKGMAIIGPPPVSEINEFKSIVDRLLSNQEKLQESARRDLASKDNEIISLQNKVKYLESNLDKKEADRKELAAENARYANVWVFVKRAFYWVVIGIGSLLVLRVVCAVVPPPYNSIGHIVDFVAGGIGRIVFGVFSKAKDAAGVVAKDTFNLTEGALVDLVQAINEVKKERRDVFDEVLAPKLDNHTDKDTTRKLIKDLARSV